MKHRWLLWLPGVILGIVTVVVGCMPHSPVHGEHLGAPSSTPQAWPSPGHCGVERWAVKTGSDSTVSEINTSQVDQTTIANLDKIPDPPGWPGILPDTRVSSVETTIYEVRGTLMKFKLEDDNDIHLVVTDTQGNTLVAEIPDPGCVSDTTTNGDPNPLKSAIMSARSTFQATYTATPEWQDVSVPVTVQGVGFFDFPHGQKGEGPHYLEQHPVTYIKFSQ